MKTCRQYGYEGIYLCPRNVYTQLAVAGRIKGIRAMCATNAYRKSAQFLDSFGIIIALFCPCSVYDTPSSTLGQAYGSSGRFNWGWILIITSWRDVHFQGGQLRFNSSQIRKSSIKSLHILTNMRRRWFTAKWGCRDISISILTSFYPKKTWDLSHDIVNNTVDRHIALCSDSGWTAWRCAIWEGTVGKE